MTGQVRIPLTVEHEWLIPEAAALNALEMTAWSHGVPIRAATEQSLRKTIEG